MFKEDLMTILNNGYVRFIIESLMSRSIQFYMLSASPERRFDFMEVIAELLHIEMHATALIFFNQLGSETKDDEFSIS